jgi:hypothetical protein
MKITQGGQALEEDRGDVVGREVPDLMLAGKAPETRQFHIGGWLWILHDANQAGNVFLIGMSTVGHPQGGMGKGGLSELRSYMRDRFHVIYPGGPCCPVVASYRGQQGPALFASADVPVAGNNSG